MKLIRKLRRWFDLHMSWFVINGRRQDEHAEYLRKKYENKN